jgi:hypothetical protein
LCAVLNSDIVNLAIKPFQAIGLLGERHIQKKLLELPIPTYNHEDRMHAQIAETGAAAREAAPEAVKSDKFPASLGRQRAFVRTHLQKELKEIDKLVATLLR